jgi:hypothetical protein
MSGIFLPADQTGVGYDFTDATSNPNPSFAF